MTILGRQWGIRSLPKDHGENMGVCDMDNMLITIYDGYPQSKINENILHEIIHALDKDMQIGLTENQVHSLGMGLSSCSAVYLVPADLPDFRYGS